MSFKKNNYIVIKNAISTELANFCYDYFLLKRQVAKHYLIYKYISPFVELFWNMARSSSSRNIFTLCRYSNGNIISKS
jgi:hypothetical protein